LELYGPAGGLVLYDSVAGVCFGPVIDGLDGPKVMGLSNRPGDFFRTPEMDEGIWVSTYISESDRLEAFLDWLGENLVSSSDQAGWLLRWERFVEYERSHIPELYGEELDEEDN
jgi:hypothetical protein